MDEIIDEPLTDALVGEDFRLNDDRFKNRTIKLLEVVEIHPTRGYIYRYETLTNENSPHLARSYANTPSGRVIIPGRKGRISRQTLDREWERISK